jgi:3-oxoacyl-[acyl-carrier-protein] synthase II
MEMEAYIRSASIISAQKTFDTPEFLTDIVEYNSNYLHCIEPSYKEFLNPIMARRMARIIKMSMAAAATCLKEAGIEQPDAIITGTALGCLEDTEKFLLAIIENDEQFLTPTSFIQSTHNTVGAQIALQLKCMGYNFTYVHKGFSFESAVLDSLMLLAEGEAKNILVGGHDEMRDKYYRVCDRIGYWKKEPVSTMQLVHSKTSGSIAGEGASFFVLSSEKKSNDYAQLRAVKTLYKPANKAAIENTLTTLLAEKNLIPADIDIVIYGINGDNRFDSIYHQLMSDYFKNSTSAYFKHLCGEYQTASGFAVWAAAKAIKTQSLPKAMIIDEPKHKAIKHILIYNTFLGTDHSVFLLSQC